MTALPDTWRSGVTDETGWSGVSMPSLTETESLICTIYRSQCCSRHDGLSRSVHEMYYTVFAVGTLCNQPVCVSDRLVDLVV